MYRFKKGLPNKCIESLYVLQCFDKYEKTRIAAKQVFKTLKIACVIYGRPLLC